MTMHFLALSIHHAPHDVLSHVLGIEVVDVHHIAEGKAAGGGVDEILLGVEATDAYIPEPGIVYHSVQHISAHAVRLSGYDILEFALCGIPHHALEIGTSVCLAGYGFIRIYPHNMEVVRICEFLALLNLLLNAGLPLVVGAVPGVNDGGAGVSTLLACCFFAWGHSTPPPYINTGYQLCHKHLLLFLSHSFIKTD